MDKNLNGKYVIEIADECYSLKSYDTVQSSESVKLHLDKDGNVLLFDSLEDGLIYVKHNTSINKILVHITVLNDSAARTLYSDDVLSIMTTDELKLAGVAPVVETIALNMENYDRTWCIIYTGYKGETFVCEWVSCDQESEGLLYEALTIVSEIGLHRVKMYQVDKCNLDEAMRLIRVIETTHSDKDSSTIKFVKLDLQSYIIDLKATDNDIVRYSAEFKLK